MINEYRLNQVAGLLSHKLRAKLNLEQVSSRSYKVTIDQPCVTLITSGNKIKSGADILEFFLKSMLDGHQSEIDRLQKIINGLQNNKLKHK